MTKAKMYISGAISNNPYYKQDFLSSERLLTAKYPEHTIINPVRMLEKLSAVVTYGELMQICFRLIDLCDSVYMLKGWEQSKGARAEHEYAKAQGKIIRYEV